jgi:hypothetical protein
LPVFIGIQSAAQPRATRPNARCRLPLSSAS